jgi:hypothetical protein
MTPEAAPAEQRAACRSRKPARRIPPPEARCEVRYPDGEQCRGYTMIRVGTERFRRCIFHERARLAALEAEVRGLRGPGEDQG